MSLYFRLREKIRSMRAVAIGYYQVRNLWYALRGRLCSHAADEIGSGLALCLRFRNEARYLAEWLRYHRAAGVKHFFLYNNYSDDNYAEVLRPFIEQNLVTLIEWTRIPASPAAEEDCIRRARGSFEWVGFIDADEFIVIRDGRSIGEFLAEFQEPGVVLHGWDYGSSRHRVRPDAPVIEAYQRRSATPCRHFKSFVRPDRVTQNNNPHSWFYRGGATAVNTQGDKVFGSFDPRRCATSAWLNHYHVKSFEDYLEKSARKPLQDRTTMAFPTRRLEWAEREFQQNNEVADTSAVDYFAQRMEAAKRHVAGMDLQRN